MRCTRGGPSGWASRLRRRACGAVAAAVRVPLREAMAAALWWEVAGNVCGTGAIQQRRCAQASRIVCARAGEAGGGRRLHMAGCGAAAFGRMRTERHGDKQEGAKSATSEEDDSGGEALGRSWRARTVGSDGPLARSTASCVACEEFDGGRRWIAAVRRR
uniref:Uncharacterized protein n=1 Tax=Setaria viridis TaxID=4556 RepID=A0A4U6UKI6_SETVI|nr:hypothetical protein SEVIR_6G211900v2 [Setaria viridis]